MANKTKKTKQPKISFVFFGDHLFERDDFLSFGAKCFVLDWIQKI